MNKIPVSSLKEGQKYTHPLLLEDDSLFIPENIVVREKDLSLLRSLEIDNVYTTGSLVGADNDKPKVEDAPKIIDVVSRDENEIEYLRLLEQSNAEASKKLVHLITQLDLIFESIKFNRISSLRALWQITATLLSIIKSDKRGVVSFILGNSIEGFNMSKNSINVAILSALISTEMGYPAQKVPEVVAGAILHDVGMLRIPDKILNKEAALTQDEAQIIASHPVGSFKIIYKELLFPKSVGVIALQHHERWDGSGYPQRLAGELIDKGALMVSVADAFEAMVSKKAYRNSLTGYQAMKNLVSENSMRFSPDTLKTFIKIMGIYPIGSCVQLNDGNIAKIIEVNSDIPLRPVVQIIKDADGKEIKGGTLIDLLQNKKLYITKAVDLKKK
jgi:HD-GYP domain-containing protein (c-di-GMP phosphodiesterase class II)